MFKFKRKIFLICCIIGLATVIPSCKKTEVNINTGSSELWVKVAPSVENLEIKFTSTDMNNSNIESSISYKDSKFSTNLVSFSNWTKVHEAFDKVDYINVTYNGKVYQVKGYGFGEKRLLEVQVTFGGDVLIIDHDISIIDVIIYVQ